MKNFNQLSSKTNAIPRKESKNKVQEKSKYQIQEEENFNQYIGLLKKEGENIERNIKLFADGKATLPDIKLTIFKAFEPYANKVRVLEDKVRKVLANGSLSKEAGELLIKVINKQYESISQEIENIDKQQTYLTETQGVAEGSRHKEEQTITPEESSVEAMDIEEHAPSISTKPSSRDKQTIAPEESTVEAMEIKEHESSISTKLSSREKQTVTSEKPIMQAGKITNQRPILSNIELSTEDEYFISIGKQGIHSFLMLGVILEDGKTRLLARVGKTNDIDPDFDSPLIMAKKALTSGTLARLADERIFRKKGSVSDIDYQAYDINYEQFKEYLAMIAAIEREQLKNNNIRDGIENVYGKNGLENQAIKCFVPVREERNGVVEFTYKNVKEFHPSITNITKANFEAKARKIASTTQEIHVNNTCHTTARRILESVLGLITNISKYFFISPPYKTKLIDGQPDSESFYRLPLPPNVAENANLKEALVLNKIYKRLEEIPKLNPESEITREKFNALKSMYKDLIGDNKLSAETMLHKILIHQANNMVVLSKERSHRPSFFRGGTATDKMINAAINELRLIIKEDEIKLKFSPTSDQEVEQESSQNFKK